MKSFTLRPVPPFRLDLTAWALRRVGSNEIDLWDGRTYRRVFVIGKDPVEVSVVQTGPPDVPELSVTATGPGAVSQEEVAPVLTKMLGLGVDLGGFYRLAQLDGRLSKLAGRFVGFKPPRFESVFEALTNGIACQQVSLIVGIIILSRLAARFGASVGEHHAFPRPQDLSEASVDDLKALGFSGRKAQNVLWIARSVVEGHLDLDGLETLDVESAETALRGIYGIGRWTAQYVQLRGMGRLDVFPADDVGAQTNLQRWLGLDERPNYEAVHAIIDQWAPYRGLIYLHLLLDGIARRGLFDPDSPSVDT